MRRVVLSLGVTSAVAFAASDAAFADTGTGGNCQTFTSTDVPKAIPDLGMATSTVNVTATGTPTSISIVNLHGSHSFMEDLGMHLVSPIGTDVLVFDQACGDNPGFNFTLDDRGSISTPCPPDDGLRHQPSNPLSTFLGENPTGTWTLNIFDLRMFDSGNLDGWGIEVCFGPTTPEPGCTSYNSTDPVQPIVDFGVATSTIDVDMSGPLTSVSIPKLHGLHTFMEDLEMHLISPMGTDVIIYEQACGDEQGFDFGLDDASSDTDPCPPNDGMIHRPSNPFSAFAGEEASGTWTLKIFDKRSQDTGELDNWTLKICMGGATCMTVSSDDIPKVIPDLGLAHSELTAPFIEVTDPSQIFYRVHAQGSHTYFEDLQFTVTSPSNQAVTLTTGKCGDYSGPFDLTWDDNAPTDSACPPNPKTTKPEESFIGTIDGQLPGGKWSLDVADTRMFDDGILNHWSLDICVGGNGPTPTPTPQPCDTSGHAGVGYGGSSPSTIVSTVVLPPGLAFAPNSCTTTIGNCIILDNTATWSANLPARPFGVTDNFDIVVVVQDFVPAGTTLCTSGTTSLGGDTPFPSNRICLTACGPKTPTPTLTPTPTPTPAPCENAGVPIRQNFEYTNEGVNPFTVILQANYPAGESPVAGTCTTTRGTCTVMPVPRTVMVTGVTLGAGEKVDFSFDAVISPSVPPNTTLCANWTASINGGGPQLINNFCGMTCNAPTATPTRTRTPTPTRTPTATLTRTPASCVPYDVPFEVDFYVEGNAALEVSHSQTV
ncbi:MAG TPA: proprotein convertase P-domain-containing protein, partial [Candidatus Acidoferrales bacterium]|nr:proprotein convertase P-domain-containing protein [Candidatus Acidoferrales bacterium]